jgi:hypothetical protein
MSCAAGHPCFRCTCCRVCLEDGKQVVAPMTYRYVGMPGQILLCSNHFIEVVQKDPHHDNWMERTRVIELKLANEAIVILNKMIN